MSYDYRLLHSVTIDRFHRALLGRYETDHLASKLCKKVYSCSNGMPRSASVTRSRQKQGNYRQIVARKRHFSCIDCRKALAQPLYLSICTPLAPKPLRSIGLYPTDTSPCLSASCLQNRTLTCSLPRLPPQRIAAHSFSR